MFKKSIIIAIMTFTISNSALAFDIQGIKPINPLDNNNRNTYTEDIGIPFYELKKATLTKNDFRNQYSIAMDKFMQSNVRTSYQDFKILIDSVTPNDYIYMELAKDMASIGLYSLSELAMTKIQNNDIASYTETDIRNFYFPNTSLTHKDQIYLAEMYSNIMYNDQSREATNELIKQTSLLNESDYANYLVAFGSLKNGEIKLAQKYINTAIEKNPKNINYKRLKAEILSQSNNSKNAISYMENLKKEEINTTEFGNILHSAQQYVYYKSSQNDYWKKYYLAYYYYDEGELNKSLRVLQTSISGKKNINKEVFALTAVIYYDLKEFEKAQDYALKTINIDPSHSKALTVMGDIAFRNQDYKQAQEYYKKATNKDSTYDSSVKLAITYQKLNNEKKAKEIYSKILKNSSKTYEAYYQIALLEKDRENTYLRKSVTINPKFQDGWIDLARLEILKENYDNATNFLNIAKYIDDNNYRYYYYWGLILKNKGLMAEAHKNFEKSLNLNPNYDLAKKELNI